MMKASSASSIDVIRGIRLVHRAASEIRRGVPVVVDTSPRLVFLSAETAGPFGLQELLSVAASRPLILFAPERGAAVFRQSLELTDDVVAALIPESLLNPNALRQLINPTERQLGTSGLIKMSPPMGALAAIVLAKLARLLPAVISVTPGSTVDLNRHSFVFARSDDILNHADAEATHLEVVGSAAMPIAATPDSRIIIFRAVGSASEHLAILIGQPERAAAPLVRVHSECFTGDMLNSLRCDCGEQLETAVSRMAKDGAGVVLYLAQEGRGIGLVNKVRAYSLQDRGLDTIDANHVLGWGSDERNFKVAARMLKILGVDRVRLLTNNPEKVLALRACGIDVMGREAHSISPNTENEDYLATKAVRFGHLI